VDIIIQKLRDIVGSDAVLSEPDELLVYECDGLPQHKYRPRAVIFPSSTEETAAVMRVLAREARSGGLTPQRCVARGDLAPCDALESWLRLRDVNVGREPQSAQGVVPHRDAPVHRSRRLDRVARPAG